MALVGKALLTAEVSRDIGAQIHLCAVLGEGFLEAHRYPDALNFSSTQSASPTPHLVQSLRLPLSLAGLARFSH
jgi:hypothetical protein